MVRPRAAAVSSSSREREAIAFPIQVLKTRLDRSFNSYSLWEDGLGCHVDSMIVRNGVEVVDREWELERAERRGSIVSGWPASPNDMHDDGRVKARTAVWDVMWCSLGRESGVLTGSVSSRNQSFQEFVLLQILIPSKVEN